ERDERQVAARGLGGGADAVPRVLDDRRDSAAGGVAHALGRGGDGVEEPDLGTVLRGAPGRPRGQGGTVPPTRRLDLAPRGPGLEPSCGAPPLLDAEVGIRGDDDGVGAQRLEPAVDDEEMSVGGHAASASASASEAGSRYRWCIHTTTSKTRSAEMSSPMPTSSRRERR